MSGRWYKRCGADFIHGTMSLSLEEKGAYSLCLDLIYDRGGPIPDDARWLSGVCGVSIRKWNALRERLINDGKLYAVDGMLSNARADFEMVSSELQRRNQAESGAKGGRKRAENAGQSPKNNNLAQATLKPIEEIRRDKSSEANASQRANALRGHRLPNDWMPEPFASDHAAYAVSQTWQPGKLERELSMFRDWAKAATGSVARKSDWQAAWRNWVVRKGEDGQQRTNTVARFGRDSATGRTVAAGAAFVAAGR